MTQFVRFLVDLPPLVSIVLKVTILLAVGWAFPRQSAADRESLRVASSLETRSATRHRSVSSAFCIRAICCRYFYTFLWMLPPSVVQSTRRSRKEGGARCHF